MLHQRVVLQLFEQSFGSPVPNSWEKEPGKPHLASALAHPWPGCCGQEGEAPSSKCEQLWVRGEWVRMGAVVLIEAGLGLGRNPLRQLN